MRDNPLTLSGMKFLAISVKLLVSMNQTDTLTVKNQFSFSGTGNFSIAIEEKIFESVGNSNESLPATEQPVNNYLKTPEEMEADFCFVINSRRAFEKDDSFDTYGRLIMRTDGYMNIQGLDEILSGSMEENY